MSRYGWWIDGQAKNLFDSGSETSWVHALPIGKYEHPVYGAMDFTPEKVNNFALSVKNKVRGTALDIDYDHKQDPAKGAVAAGWVNDAEVRPDGLYLNVKWTPAARTALEQGEYRYFSPEFDDEWTDGKGTKHTDVLFGGALTNRPFLKDLMPVNLSEVFAQGGKVFGQSTPTPPQPVPPVRAPIPAAPVALSDDVIAKLLADSPAFKALSERVQAAESRAAEAERSRRLSETKHRLSAITATQDGRKYVLPPSVVDAIANASVETDSTKLTEGFVSALEQFGKVGYVELGERGKMRATTGNDVSPTVQLGQAVLQMRTAHFQTTGKTLSYTDAVRAVVAQNPSLYMDYREDAYAGKED